MSLTITELADASGCHPDLVEVFERAGVIESIRYSDGTVRYRESTISRLSQGLRLRRDLGINLTALGLVLDLLERVERLEDELQRARAYQT
jgi:DNA-binding transcriptional MerR regulator